MSEDPIGQEPTAAIDLARPKKGRATGGAGGPERKRPRLDAVRHSVRDAGHVAAPYLTMARIVWTRLARDRMARAGGVVLALLALIALLADLLASDLPVACRWRGVIYLAPDLTHPAALEGTDCTRMSQDRRPGDWLVPPLVAHGPTRQGDARDVLRGPFEQGHPLGTDAFGRDVFARVVHGARTALGIGMAASVALVTIGVTLGALAGFSGGMVDALVARAVESLTAIPTIVLVLVVGALVPHPTTTTLLATIALTRWTELARLVRAEVLLALRADYVTAARALGASAVRVLWRHVLPNAIAPAIVAAAFALAWVVLVEATVDFLRVGYVGIPVDGAASWGETLGEARANANAWWLVVCPGVLLLATLIALNLVGEAARNAFDPRLRGDDEGR